MKKCSHLTYLALAPSIAFAHEGVDPANILHTLAHLGESYGLVAALPAAIAIALVLKRRRATAKSSPTK